MFHVLAMTAYTILIKAHVMRARFTKIRQCSPYWPDSTRIVALWPSCHFEGVDPRMGSLKKYLGFLGKHQESGVGQLDYKRNRGR